MSCSELTVQRGEQPACSRNISVETCFISEMIFSSVVSAVAGESGWPWGSWLEFLISSVISWASLSHIQWETDVLYKHFAFFKLFTIFSSLPLGINVILMPTCGHIFGSVLMSFHHCLGIFQAKCWRKCSNYS